MVKKVTRSTWRPPRDRTPAKQELPDFLLYPINHAYKKMMGRKRKKDDLLYDKKTYGMPPPGQKRKEPPNLDREKRWREEDEAIRRSKMRLVDPATCVDVYKNCEGLDINELVARLRYVPETGGLYWIKSNGGKSSNDPIVRLTVVINKRVRNVLGVIYLVYTGALPTGRVAFRDGDPNNWRWENIKPSTHAELAAEREKVEERIERRRRRAAPGVHSAQDAIAAITKKAEEAAAAESSDRSP